MQRSFIRRARGRGLAVAAAVVALPGLALTLSGTAVAAVPTAPAAPAAVAPAAVDAPAAPAPADAPADGPCDLYAAGGTPCVAAHSTTRALYAGYDGPLYQVQRASDDATKDIGVMSPGGFAAAGDQDTFCAGTTCVITVIYDQSPQGNDLTPAPKGGFSGTGENGNDSPADAAAAPVKVDGHEAYGVLISPGMGYRDNDTTGIATGDDPEGMYAVMDATRYNGGCCFDYGNAETDSHDDGNGTMEAIYFGSATYWGTGTGNGPWVMADLENGLFSGVHTKFNANDPSIGGAFVTAMIKGGPDQWAIESGDSQAGDLTVDYHGARPSASGYDPMKKQGAIILGIGGDNSVSATGTFYEGVMTSGYPSEATDRKVQADIATASYTAVPIPLDAGPRVHLQVTTPGSTDQYLTHDLDDDVAITAPVPDSAPDAEKQAAVWVEAAGLSDASCTSFESTDKPGFYLRHYAFHVYLQRDDGSPQFAQDATFCQQPGNSGTGDGVSFQSVNYPTHYLRTYQGAVYNASDGGSDDYDTTAGWPTDTTWVVTDVSTPSGPQQIAVPAAPVWTDACGPADNGSFSGYTDTAQYTWKVTDHSALDGKVGITVTPTAGYVFPDGARTRWTRVQDNSPCTIDVPAAPVWTDACGPADNGSFSGYTDTAQYTWKVTDHSALDGKVGITVTPTAGYVFPDGARTRWTRVQDNSPCTIDVPAAPAWTDACGPDNGSFSGYSNTAAYTWKVTDHSALNGKVGITVTPTAGNVFPAGARTSWTRTQDDTPCPAPSPTT